jgi:hypothetical protein
MLPKMFVVDFRDEIYRFATLVDPVAEPEFLSSLGKILVLQTP